MCDLNLPATDDQKDNPNTQQYEALNDDPPKVSKDQNDDPNSGIAPNGWLDNRPQGPPKTLPKFLSTDEVLERLGCSRAALYRAVRNGVLPGPAKLGRRSLWPETNLANAMEALLQEFGEANLSSELAKSAGAASVASRQRKAAAADVA